MKRIIPFCFLFIFSFSIHSKLKAQILWQDDIDAFISDTLLEPQSPAWIGWGNALTSSYTSTDQAFNGANSIKIWNATLPGNVVALSDVIRKFGDSTSGRFLLKFKVYVPSVGVAAGTYWNILHSMTTTNVGTEWAMEVFLRPKGTLSTIRVGGVEYPIPARYDTWVEVAHVFDLDRDLADFFYDGKFVVRQPFSFQSFLTSGLKQLSAIDLFAECNSPGCVQLGYFDDFLFKRLPDPGNDAGITEIIIPRYCLGDSTPVSLTVRNWGFNNLDTFLLNWSINDTLQTPFLYSGRITPNSIETIFVGNHLFSGQSPFRIKAWASNVNNQQDTVTFNDSARSLVGGPALGGIYTIDPGLPAGGNNYQSFDAFAQDINLSGVCSSVYVNVAPGTYNELVKFEKIDGTNDSTRVTIDGGDSSLVFIENNQLAQNALISLKGVSYMSIKNMTLRSTYLGNIDHFGIHFSEGSTHDSILACNILLNPSNTGGGNVIGASTNTSNSFSEGITASDIVIMNCALDGGFIGVHFEASGLGSFENKRNTFLNNTLTNQFFYGFFMDGQDTLHIEGNSITRMRNTIANGMQLQNPMNFKVNANFVNAVSVGINVLNANSFAISTTTAELINNMISTGSSTGLFLSSPVNIAVWHNSVFSASSAEAVFIGGIFSDSVDFRNNILYGVNGPALRTNVADSLLFLKLDNNVYHTDGTILLNHNGITHNSLANYQAAQSNFDIRSLEGNPGFTSTTDLHIVGTFVNNSGDNFLPVAVDIDGDPRPLTPSIDVDPGADEFDPPLCPPPSSFSSANPSIDSVSILVNGISMEYEWEIIRLGALRGSGSSGIIFGDSTRVGGLTASTNYELYVREICGRGDTSVWIGPVFFTTAFGIPFVENFESFPSRIVGNPWPRGWASNRLINPRWESLTSNGFNWSSGNTGPLVDHTLSPLAGGTYVFLETSGGSQGNFDEFISAPIFVDSNFDSLDFSFWYHMHGASMGTLEVLIDTNGVRNTVTSIVGQQQVNQADAWLKRSLILRGYAGKSIRLVFKGIRGTSFTGDMAIDDIELKSFDAFDLSISNLSQPIEANDRCYSSNEAIIVQLLNSGTIPIDFNSDTARIRVSVSGVGNFFNTFVLSNNSLNSGLLLAPNDSLRINLGSINMAAPGIYNFVIDVTSGRDFLAANDTFTTSVNVVLPNGGFILGLDSICNGDSVLLTSSNFQGKLQWQIRNGANWNNLVNDTLPSVYVQPLVFSEYRVLACGNAVSDTLSITPILVPSPTLLSDTVRQISGVCGQAATVTGIVANVQSGVTYKWFDAPIGGNEITSAGQFSISNVGDSISLSVSNTVLGSPASANVWVEASVGNVVCSRARVPLFLFIDCVVGLENNGLVASNSLRIYPNPSSGRFTLEIETEKATQFKFRLSDLSGKTITYSEFWANGNYRKEFDFAELAKGIYFMQFQSGNKLQTKKIVIY